MLKRIASDEEYEKIMVKIITKSNCNMALPEFK
jgi:hypothetical protein